MERIYLKKAADRGMILLKCLESNALDSILGESNMTVNYCLGIPTEKLLNYNWLADSDAIQYGNVALHENIRRTASESRKTEKDHKQVQSDLKLLQIH